MFLLLFQSHQHILLKVLGLLIGYADGFEKAKETYKYTEEDLRKAIEFGRGMELWKEEEQVDKFIQALNQPKLPVAFECYVDNILSHNADAGADALVLSLIHISEPTRPY